MPAPKKKNKKNKNKKTGGGGHHGGRKNPPKQKNRNDKKKKDGKQNPKKNDKNKQIEIKQSDIMAKMPEEIDLMYNDLISSNKHMRTFFGIFTKHNQLQLRVLMDHSIPNINKNITDKYLRSTQKDEVRDLNQFIYLGDVVIGAYSSELQNSQKDLVIRFFCVLPNFRRYGFGSRLMIHLIKNAVKRKKANNMILYIDKEEKNGIKFFERFGFKESKNNKSQSLNGTLNGTSPNNKNKNNTKNKPKNKPKDEQKEEENDNDNDNNKNIKMIMNLRLYKSTTAALIKKKWKDEKSKSNKSTKSPTPKQET